LTQMIENTAAKEGIPIRREDVYICNVVKCRPPENRAPQPDEMEICGQFLYRQLMTIKPKAICALGGTAMRALLNTKQGITKMRGEWQKWNDIPLMITYHPSYLLRQYNQDAKREAWLDLRKLLHFVYD
jgi:uracil-DNA glycosylase